MKICLQGFFCVLLNLLSVLVFSQQLPQFTQFYFTQLPFNPAYVGSKSGVNIESAIRVQWLGIQGQPFTQTLGVHVPASRLRSGLGLHLSNDQLGVERNTKVQLSYAYQHRFKRKALLALGLQGGMIQKSLNGAALISPEGIYDAGIDHNDNLLPNTTEMAFAPTVGVGIYFATKSLTLGASTQQLLPSSFSLTAATNETLLLSNYQHYFLYGSYKWALNYTISLQPSFLLKSDLKTQQLDLGILAFYKDFIHFGSVLRGYKPKSLNAVSIVVGISLSDKLMLSYSYDAVLSSLNNNNYGSHEMVLHYRLSSVLPSKSGKIMHNPRFM